MFTEAAFSATTCFACFLVATNRTFFPDLAICFKASAASSILATVLLRSNIDFVIPANDDATKSVEVILDACCAAMQEGLEERKAEKVDMEAAGDAPANKGKKKATKARLDKSDEEAINAAKAAAFMKEEEA